MKTISHKFVKFIPNLSEMEEGVLYISMEYGSVVHKCACGCGNEVVTPLTPTDWKLAYNGESVSLYPSIGNWDFSCQSHYWIKESKVSWAVAWSRSRIDLSRKSNLQFKKSYYNRTSDSSFKESKKNFFHRLKKIMWGTGK